MQHYFSLHQQLLQSVSVRPNYGVVVAFTSPTPRAGVTYVVKSLATELARHSEKRILVANLSRLQQFGAAQSLQQQRGDLRNLWTLEGELEENTSQAMVPRESHIAIWQRNAELRQASLEALQMSFDYVLLDCPSLKMSTAAALLAPLVDGIALVVEAGRTRRDEIQSAQRTLELMKAPFFGFILNKRKYPVPEWLYRRL
ncbi:MAG: hypothetical protein JNM09_27630 [Blastocatellia bacterium]|nr:hypothetical protein [Blastocatellia bacterium]